jgi:hypothetical protein
MKSTDQGTGIREQEPDAMERLLRSTLPPVGDHPEPHGDLWPAMRRRFDEESTHRLTRIPWFDWALATGLVAFAAMAPHTIPVILFYL